MKLFSLSGSIFLLIVYNWPFSGWPITCHQPNTAAPFPWSHSKGSKIALSGVEIFGFDIIILVSRDYSSVLASGKLRKHVVPRHIFSKNIKKSLSCSSDKHFWNRNRDLLLEFIIWDLIVNIPTCISSSTDRERFHRFDISAFVRLHINIKLLQRVRRRVALIIYPRLHATHQSEVTGANSWSSLSHHSGADDPLSWSHGYSSVIDLEVFGFSY